MRRSRVGLSTRSSNRTIRLQRSGKILLAVGVLGAGAAATGLVLEWKRGRDRSGTGKPPALPPPQLPTPTPVDPAPAPHHGGHVYAPTVESWRNSFLALGPDIPIAASIAWISEESGGRPCDIGGTPGPGATEPQEYGIAQLNAQDPSNVAIATPQELRGNGLCGVGPSRAEWTAQLRPLTDVEQIHHASTALDLMRRCRTEIAPYVSGWGWDERGPDFWQMVKLWHASPALVKVAHAIAQQLGRTPHNFAEYQSHADAIGLANNLGAGHTGGSRGYLDSVWLNVHRIGAALAAPSAGV